MPSPDDVFRDLEEARAVRENEVRLLLNLTLAEGDEDRVLALRRSVVLVTYAHLEGFCRVAMDTYVSAVNSLKVRCSDAVAPLVAATLHRAFVALRNIQSKHPEFARPPVDDALHMVWREQRFVERVDSMMSVTVEIPDGVVNTEMNLSPDVLKRNMYRLGLDYGAVDGEKDGISRLLGKRNQIAHGEMTSPTKEEVDAYVSSAFKTMLFVQSQIYDALANKSYMKPAA